MDSAQNNMTEATVPVDETDATSSLTTDCDEELNEADKEEKQRLIKQILELQHTLEDLSARVDVVKEENLKLHSENQILGQYIENMMANSSVFQSTSPHSFENRRHVTSGNTRGT
ncbi:short coiled-coil protein [Paragonimus westermani]|uniref:Short coiled-coil protein n=1 Tax=Paragonimus westermani TaxID=34504 RepID=A0A5J4NGF8_9TREM|nr:short coiled-coil protein [Paragonimus westermani]